MNLFLFIFSSFIKMFYSTFAHGFDLAGIIVGNVEQFNIFDNVQIFG